MTGPLGQGRQLRALLPQRFNHHPVDQLDCHRNHHHPTPLSPLPNDFYPSTYIYIAYPCIEAKIDS